MVSLTPSTTHARLDRVSTCSDVNIRCIEHEGSPCGCSCARGKVVGVDHDDGRRWCGRHFEIQAVHRGEVGRCHAVVQEVDHLSRSSYTRHDQVRKDGPGAASGVGIPCPRGGVVGNDHKGVDEGRRGGGGAEIHKNNIHIIEYGEPLPEGPNCGQTHCVVDKAKLCHTALHRTKYADGSLLAHRGVHNRSHSRVPVYIQFTVQVKLLQKDEITDTKPRVSDVVV